MENRRFTMTELNSHFLTDFPLLVARKCHGAPIVQKLCASWMPNQLIPEHKARHIESALAFLQRYHDNVDEFLDRIITGDET